MIFRNSADESKLFEAVQDGNLKIVAELLRSNHRLAKAKRGPGLWQRWSVLHSAVAMGHANIVKILVASGAKTSARYDGRTLLHEAVGCVTGIAHFEVVQSLLSYGLNPNVKDKMGQTPLHHLMLWSNWAAEHPKQRKAIVELLLANKANANALDKKHNTPLHLGASCCPDNSELVDLLISYGANLRSKDQYDNEPLHLAASKGCLNITELFVSRGAYIDARNVSYMTPLHCAVSNGHVEIAIYLLTHGANADAQDDLGMRPLHWLALSGTVNADLIKLLLVNKASLNNTDKDGSTPLYLAALEGRTNMVESLLRLGADASKKNKLGRTALEIATLNGHKETASVIRSLT